MARRRSSLRAVGADMRAEITHLAQEIEQGLSLLRRHL
jgi:hypothetical protein